MSNKEYILVAHCFFTDPAIFCNACFRITVWSTGVIYGLSFQWDSQVLYIYMYSHLLVSSIMQSLWYLSISLATVLYTYPYFVLFQYCVIRSKLISCCRVGRLYQAMVQKQADEPLWVTCYIVLQTSWWANVMRTLLNNTITSIIIISLFAKACKGNENCMGMWEISTPPPHFSPFFCSHQHICLLAHLLELSVWIMERKCLPGRLITWSFFLINLNNQVPEVWFAFHASCQQKLIANTCKSYAVVARTSVLNVFFKSWYDPDQLQLSSCSVNSFYQYQSWK